MERINQFIGSTWRGEIKHTKGNKTKREDCKSREKKTCKHIENLGDVHCTSGLERLHGVVDSTPPSNT
jgi:hypothetical protein